LGAEGSAFGIGRGIDDKLRRIIAMRRAEKSPRERRASGGRL